jgi:hypothetical protein
MFFVGKGKSKQSSDENGEYIFSLSAVFAPGMAFFQGKINLLSVLPYFNEVFDTILT